MCNTVFENGMELIDCRTGRFTERMARDVLLGLTANQKYISSKYFYDARGSELFEKICELPEYYPTRLESALLSEKAEELIRNFHGGDLIGLGSGSHWKIRTLLDALDSQNRALTRYVSVDVSQSAILASGVELGKTYPELEVLGVVADFTRDLHRLPEDRPKLMLFFGSTIGNLKHSEAVTFLRNVAGSLKRGDRFILGIDLIKPVEILEAAYNDAQGLTAEFNKNVLLVMNHQLGANFRIEEFDHLAFFNEQEERVEMHLRANRPVKVEIPRLDATIALEQGETIHTEICRKFNWKSAQQMVHEGGLTITHRHTDPQDWFALLDLQRADAVDPEQSAKLSR